MKFCIRRETIFLNSQRINLLLLRKMYENIRYNPYLTLIIPKSSTWTPYLELVFKLRKSSSTRIYQAQKLTWVLETVSYAVKTL